MKRKILYIVSVLLFVATSCQKSELTTFSDQETSLNFIKGKAYPSLPTKYDSLLCSTVFAPKINSVRQDMKIRIPVILSGKPSDIDRTYRVEVVDTATREVVAGRHYEFSTTQTLKANQVRDTVEVTLKSLNLDEDRVKNGRLYLRLVPNENFVRGVARYEYIILNIYGGILPEGENNAPELYFAYNYLDKYIGYFVKNGINTYSTVKTAVFIDVNNITDPFLQILNKAVLMEMARKAYLYLENNIVMESDGVTRARFNGTIKFQ